MTNKKAIDSSRHHGGLLLRAAEQFGIDRSQWLDLSTGINPHAWPVTSPPADIWSRLPEDDDGLLQSAMDYYGSDALLALAGSQAAIQYLPTLRDKSRVVVASPSYSEHAYNWLAHGHQVSEVPFSELGDYLDQADVAIVVNPNNPSGQRYSVKTLLSWSKTLAARGAWLIVDEAYMDCYPDSSLLPFSPRPGLLVLRSLGKFFGLAGLRLGFISAEPVLLKQLQQHIGPWSINGPARWVAKQALADSTWQQHMRACLSGQGKKLHDVLSQHLVQPSGGCALFQWVIHNRSDEIYHALARRGILTRLYQTPCSIRFGLPGSDKEWQRLTSALQQIKTEFVPGGVSLDQGRLRLQGMGSE